MGTDKITEKVLQGYRYGIFTSGDDSAIFETVPAGLADQWLASAPNARTLILCGTNPYPKSVERFLKEHPDGKIYAAPYIAYTLAGILGADFPCIPVRDTTTVSVGSCEICFSTVSQPGKSAYLIADLGSAGTFSGAKQEKAIPAVEYASPTVAIAYVSGCDYTELIAEKIAEGIRDTQGLDTLLCDLNARGAEEAISLLSNADGILLGTPTINGDASKKIWELLTTMSADIFAGKPAAVFGSYTWDNSGVSNIAERIRQLKMNLYDGGFSIQYKPGENELSSAYEYGYYYGCKLQNKPNTHQSKLVKCIVCGEIFDASLGICPVCGVGMDKCVPVEDEIINHKEDTSRRYVIAGGGTAALSAAEAIRKRDKTGKIIVISAEDCLPINRPMLSKNMVIAARVKDCLAIKPPEWFAEFNIDIRLGTEVTSIDTQNKNVTLSDRTQLHYDKLIYAMGAECFIPSIPGTELDGVLSVRHLKDVHNIWSRLPDAKKAVVIGGGVLGLEAAAELKKARLEVVVLEMAPQIMARQLDAEAASCLIRAADNYGVKVHTNVSIAKICGDSKCTGVELADGTIFPADIVVMSCGNKATVDVAKAAGIKCARAIQVTSKMETSVADIYASGDCAQIDGVNYQLWAEASEQGRVAGANAAGDTCKYVSIPYGASFEGFNTKLFAMGDVGKQDKSYKKVEFRDEISGCYRKYWFCDNRICGGILYGNTDTTQILSDAITQGSDYHSLMGKL